MSSEFNDDSSWLPNASGQLKDLILQCAGEGIYGLDLEGQTTFINPAGAKMLGWDTQSHTLDSKPATVRRTRHDGSPCPHHECPIYASLTDGATHRVDHEIFWRADGSSFPVEYVTTPILDEHDTIQGAVVTFSDITQRRKIENELAQLRLHHELILSSAGEGIYGLDTQGLTTFVNPAAEAILGWRAEELLGKPQHDLIHHTKPNGETYPRSTCPIYAAFSDGAVHRVEDEWFWHKDGTPIPVEYVSTPVHDNQGKLAGAVVTFKDITQRKQREEALIQALAQIKTLQERLQAENLYLRDEIKISHNFEQMIGQSPAMVQAQHLVEQVAITDATVLLLGESGVGKELFTHAIHNLSMRKGQTIVKVNCAALPSTLIESELFGHEKGAFTGATAKRTGRFELADRGTIFLDEIGELPLELQAKLLRVIQEGEFEPLGSTQTKKVDIRIIAATNRDLSKMVLSGDFRDDLYYRLNVFPVKVPPLRDRKEDIPLLVTYFVSRFAEKFGKQIDKIPTHALESLQAYDWPGNIRELENIIERAVILTPDASLHVDEAFTIRRPKPEGYTLTNDQVSFQHSEIALNEDLRSLEQVERSHILGILKKTNWRVDGHLGAAKILKLNPSTLRSRMKKLAIMKP